MLSDNGELDYEVYRLWGEVRDLISEREVLTERLDRIEKALDVLTDPEFHPLLTPAQRARAVLRLN